VAQFANNQILKGVTLSGVEGISWSSALCLWEIPRPAGENAGLRQEVSQGHRKNFTLSRCSPFSHGAKAQARQVTLLVDNSPADRQTTAFPGKGPPAGT
jgi:hypothetical protein